MLHQLVTFCNDPSYAKCPWFDIYTKMSLMISIESLNLIRDNELSGIGNKLWNSESPSPLTILDNIRSRVEPSVRLCGELSHKNCVAIFSSTLSHAFQNAHFPYVWPTLILISLQSRSSAEISRLGKFLRGIIPKQLFIYHSSRPINNLYPPRGDQLRTGE